MSSDWTELQAEDGHRFRAWLALPNDTPIGSVVVIQEIFGVNRHIRWVAEQLAAHGYAAYAPCLFDRVGGNVDLDYTDAGVASGRERITELGFDAALRDIAATAKRAAAHGRVACMGFCWGGTLAWLAATRLALPAISYYGARTGPFLDEVPKAPLLMHFGSRDALIPESFYEALQTKHPQVPVFFYNAGHGFNCNERADFHAESAAMAWRRNHAFLRQHLEQPAFPLHPKLAADTFEVAELGLCRVLLMNDARFPWLILVPRVNSARELIDLSRNQQHQLMDEVARASAVLQSNFDPLKLNVAALGNQVPQLHVHVIARFAADAAWPNAVFGVGAAQPYAESDRRRLIDLLRAGFAG